jgi:heme-degrading monooxygenase HmoA
MDGPDEKEFHTIAARFALKGHALHRSTRAADGHATFIVSNWGQSRAFSNWHDVQAFLVQIGGAA